MSVTEVTFHQGHLELCHPTILLGSHVTLMEIKADVTGSSKLTVDGKI